MTTTSLTQTRNPAPSTTEQDFSAILTRALHQVEEAMIGVVNSDVEILRDASRHILLAGGKRVRPRLTLLAYAAAGGTTLSDVISAAAAIELVHTASVVHDDINDHGVMRRGRPSVNALWGRTFALLTGDFLFTKVYELMAPFNDMNVILAEATVALVEGETMQASAVKQGRFTREIYYQIIARKTAALFRAAARIGAEMAGASQATSDALSEYAFNIGLAFQIIDDILDLTADSETLGKTAGIDVEQGRGYAAAYASGNGSAVNESASPTDPMQSIKSKLLQGDAINEAREQAYQLANMAIAALDVLPASDAKAALIDLARLVVERER